MARVISDNTRKSRKDHNCCACEWLLNYGLGQVDFTFAEYRTIAKAKRNKWRVKKGETYLSQCNVQDGDIQTIKAIPAIHDLCVKYDLYQCD